MSMTYCTNEKKLNEHLECSIKWLCDDHLKITSIYDDTVDCGVRMMMMMMMYDIQLSCTIAREQVKLFSFFVIMC